MPPDRPPEGDEALRTSSAGTLRPPPDHEPGRPLWVRGLRKLGAFVGTAVVFVLSLALGVALHLNTPQTRRVLVERMNAMLAPTVQGRIRIERMGQLDLLGLAKTDVTIDDPRGRPVIVVRGARIRIDTLGAARSALFGKGEPLTIDLSSLSADSIDVRLDTDPQGTLDLAAAFAPRNPSAPDPTARGLRLVIARVSWSHAWAHGQMEGAPPLDVDVDDLRGALTYAPDVLEGRVDRARVKARGIANGADATGSLEGSVRAPSAPGREIDARLAWQGEVAGLEQTVRASLLGDHFDAVVDVPQAAPANVRALWPASPLDEPARAHLEARGTRTDVDFGLNVGIGDAVLDGGGSVTLGDVKSARLTLDAHGIDVHELAAAAPRSRLGLTGEIAGEMKTDGALSGSANLHFLGGRIGARAVPGAWIHARGSRSPAKEVRGSAEIVVDEPGAPAQVSLRLLPRRDSVAVAFDLGASAADLAGIPELRHAVRGSVQLAATGELDVGSRTIDARVAMRTARLAQGTTRVDSATLEAHAHGDVSAPGIEVALVSSGIVAGGVRWDTASVTAAGSASAAHVSVSARGPDTPDIEASGDVRRGGGVTLGDLRVALARGADRALVTARRVDVGDGGVRIADARVVGVGAPATANLVITPGVLQLRAATLGLDLGAVGRLAGNQRLMTGGSLAFDTDLDLRRDYARGRAMLDMTKLDVGRVKDVSVHLDATLEGRKLAGSAHAKATGVGSVDLEAFRIELAGAAPLSAASWRGAWGSLDLGARGDLARVAALLPPGTTPVGGVRGQVALQAHLARDDIHDLSPDLDVSLSTDKLALAARTPTSRDIDGVLVHPPPAWHMEGVDFVVRAHVDGNTGALAASAVARDARGTLAQLDVASHSFPFTDVFEQNGRLAADLRTTPFDAHLVVPERWLGSLPQVLQQRTVSGRLQADVRASGTILAPSVNAAVALRRASFAGGEISTLLDVDVAARYDGAHGSASVRARSGGRELLALEARGNAAIAQFFDASGAPPVWDASGRAHLTGFPIESIPALDDKLVSGSLSGDIALVDLHNDAHADASLTVDGLTVGSIGYRSARLRLAADGRTIDGSVRIDQTDGFAEAKAHANATWGAALAPALSPDEPLEATLSTKNFRIAALLPFVDGALDELDGRLDGDTRLALDPRVRKVELTGALALTRGTVEASGGGGELHDITANVRLSPGGLVTVEDLTARGLTGRLQAAATARLDGLTLRSARAVVVIPAGSAIPLRANGTEVGDVDGRVEVTEMTSGDGKAIDVKVEVPDLRVALPEGSSNDAQALGPMPRVRIGAHRGDPATFVLLPLDPVKTATRAAPTAGGARVRVETHLASVLVSKGTQLRVALGGRVNVKDDPTAPVTGQITLKKGGMLDVQGKKFTIENGTVTFTGDDASNPEVVVKASWTAPEGTVVYASFNGPLQTGKVTLSSEPTLPQQEIVELLLFGTTDGKQAQTPGGTTTDTAIGTVGGQAAQPLNHALNQVGLRGVSASV
ncbi:MAG TPA: translocation/assembly module TamB domain-containing protein, partial [Polyangiaceae bacterium]